MFYYKIFEYRIMFKAICEKYSEMDVKLKIV